MYSVKDNLIFGFHGCDESLCDKLVNGDSLLNYSKNPYDCLGKCLDFMEIANLQKLKKIYDELTSSGIDLPENTGKDFYKRNLDCFLINYLVAQEKLQGNVYDSVRGVFFEGDELYENAGFRERNHIQISVINPNCIKGYFKVREVDGKFSQV